MVVAGVFVLQNGWIEVVEVVVAGVFVLQNGRIEG